MRAWCGAARAKARLRAMGGGARVVCHRLGSVPYMQALALQKRLVERRRAQLIPDTLLLVQHPPVFTLGRLQESQENVLVSPEQAAEAGATIAQSDRGGNVTFHGPGQLVAYPILDLGGYKRSLRWYISKLEDTVIETAAAFDLKARAGDEGQTGVWIGDRKLAAIGISVKRWITSHGIALNANVDLKYFDMIVPCGLRERRHVTSLSAELRRPVEVDEVAPLYVSSFARAFSSEVVLASEDTDNGDLMRLLGADKG